MNNYSDIQQKIMTMNSKVTAVINTLPTQIGAIILKETDNNFKKHGFNDTLFEPWRPLSRAYAAIKKPDRGILIRFGELRSSLRIVATSVNSITVATVGIPYAKAHNEGYTGTIFIRPFNRNKYKTIEGVHTIMEGNNAGKKMKVKNSTVDSTISVNAHVRTIKIPQRKFLGDSVVLRNNVSNFVINKFLKITT